MTFNTDTIYLNLDTFPTDDVLEDLCDAYQMVYESFYFKQIPYPSKLWIGYSGVRMCYVSLEINLISKNKKKLLEASIA